MKPPHTGTKVRKRQGPSSSSSVGPPPSTGPQNLTSTVESSINLDQTVPDSNGSRSITSSTQAPPFFPSSLSFFGLSFSHEDSSSHSRNISSVTENIYNSPSRSTTLEAIPVAQNSDVTNSSSNMIWKRKQLNDKTNTTKGVKSQELNEQEQQEEWSEKIQDHSSNVRAQSLEQRSSSRANAVDQNGGSAWESFEGSPKFSQNASDFSFDPEDWSPSYHPYVIDRKKMIAPNAETPSSSAGTSSTAPTSTTDSDLQPQPIQRNKQQIPSLQNQQNIPSSSSKSPTASETRLSPSPLNHRYTNISRVSTMPVADDRSGSKLMYEKERQRVDILDGEMAPEEKKGQKESGTANHLTKTSSKQPQSKSDTTTKIDVSHLLKFPVPEDRKQRRRMLYEREGRFPSFYDSEVEPHGTRGQEATGAKSIERSTSLLKMRSFSPQERPLVSLLAKPTANAVNSQSRSTSAGSSRNTKYVAHSRSLDDGTSTNSTPVTTNRPQHLQSTLPKPILRNRKSNSLTSPSRSVLCRSLQSVGSEEELQQMRSDLVEEVLQETQNERRAPRDSGRNGKSSPSPAAVAAATAAAQSLRLDNTSTRNWASDTEMNPQNAVLNRNKDVELDADELTRLAMQDVEEGRFDEAVARCTRVLTYQITQHGTLHPAVASAHHNLGTLYAKWASAFPEDSPDQKNAQSLALKSFQAAARTARDSLSPQHPNVAVSLVRIGFLLLLSKQYENAVITFREALRIRKLAYGPSHPLVANLCNNLGVCHMHMGEFEKGRHFLETALAIQRDLLAQNKPDDSTLRGSSSQSLELADTLFNIGGLCLEWIRKRGLDVSRLQDAESAFQEAFQIRNDVLGPNDPVTIQCRDLLNVSRAIPRPPTTQAGATRYHAMDSKTKDGTQSMSTPPATPKKYVDNYGDLTPPPVISPRPESNMYPSTPPNLEDRTRKKSPTNQNRSKYDDEQSDYSAASGRFGRNGIMGNMASPKQQPRLVTPSANASQPSSFPESLRPSSRPTSPASLRSNAGTGISANVRMRSVNSTTNNYSSLVQPSLNERSPRASFSQGLPGQREGGLSPSVAFRDEETENMDSSSRTHPRNLFRGQDSFEQSDVHHGTAPKSAEPEWARFDESVRPSMNEVTVLSGDEVELSTSGTTKVFVRPHHVPRSPGRLVQQGINRYLGASPNEPPSVAQSRYPFDPEENCLIGDSGIDSEYGRVHIPSSWVKAGLILDEEPLENRPREIMVTRPSRVTRSQRKQKQANGGSEDKDYNNKKVFYETKDKERFDIMRRTAEFIRDHERLLGHDTSSFGEEKRETEHADDSEQDSVEESVQVEEGLAELGGDWLSSPNRGRCSIEEMIEDPMMFLPEIYDEACRRIKRDNSVGALPLFRVILQCQRDRYGPTHEHVASAVFNLGMIHLRLKEVEEALEAFKAASEIRTAFLGYNHPLVAVSLVKVGIAHLLLLNFSEALWNFREALTVRKQVLGPLHPSTARIYNNIGCVHVEFNELREARVAFEAALDIQRTALSNDPGSKSIMLATATTLSNLAYLYRNRELHGKAALVLKEAADFQEAVLGRSNPLVLSTLDCLADSCVSGGQTTDALRFYNMILTRYRVGEAPWSQSVLRAETVLLYKMSRVHRQRNDTESQLDALKLALRSVHALLPPARPKDTFKENMENRILSDMRLCRDQVENSRVKWL